MRKAYEYPIAVGGATMTHKERILAAGRGEVPDLLT